MPLCSLLHHLNKRFSSVPFIFFNATLSFLPNDIKLSNTRSPYSGKIQQQNLENSLKANEHTDSVREDCIRAIKKINKRKKKKKVKTGACIKTLEISIIFPVSRNGYSWLQQSYENLYHSSSWILLSFFGKADSCWLLGHPYYYSNTSFSLLAKQT